MSSLIIGAVPAPDDPIHRTSTEPVAHLTMLFFGDIAGVQNLDQIREALAHAAATSPGPVTATVTHRGELGDEGADVLFLNPGALRNLRSLLLEVPEVRAAFDAVQQYPIWTPHVTIGYPDRPATGEIPETIRFDRVALWEGEYVGPEFLLGGGMVADASSNQWQYRDQDGKWIEMSPEAKQLQADRGTREHADIVQTRTDPVKIPQRLGEDEPLITHRAGPGEYLTPDGAYRLVRVEGTTWRILLADVRERLPGSLDYPSYQDARSVLEAFLRHGNAGMREEHQRLLALVAGGDSWRWQLRDRNGKWIEMGAEVRWLAKGMYKHGIVIDSPEPGMAKVQEVITNLVHNIPSARLEVVKSAAEVLETTVQRRQQGARWQDLDLPQNPALVQFVQQAKEGKATLTDWSTSDVAEERFLPDEVRDVLREAIATYRARTTWTRQEVITAEIYDTYLRPLGLTETDLQNMRAAIAVTLSDEETRDEFWTEHGDEIQVDRINELRGGQVAIRVTPNVLRRLLADGRYKSQFETNNSRGTYAPSLRAQMELAMMGLHPDLDPTQRPVYGYMYQEGHPWDADGILGSYGEIILLLRPEVRQRTTMTLGDSLGGGALPMPVTGEVSRRQMSDALTWPARGAFTRNEPFDVYHEAQIHGGVTLDDIEAIVVPDDSTFGPLPGIPVLTADEYLAAHPVTKEYRGWTLAYKKFAWSATKDKVMVETTPPEDSDILQQILGIRDHAPRYSSLDEARSGIDRMMTRYAEIKPSIEDAKAAKESGELAELTLEEETGDILGTYEGWSLRISEEYGVEATHPDTPDTLYFPSLAVARDTIDRFDLLASEEPPGFGDDTNGALPW